MDPPRICSPYVFLALLFLCFRSASSSTTTCDTLNAFYADTSVSNKQLYKFTRTLTKFCKATVNYPLHTLAKELRAQLSFCKDPSTLSRTLISVSRITSPKSAKLSSGSGSGHHGVHLHAVGRATTEEEQESMQRMCESLQKRKESMGIDSVVEQMVYDTYLLSSTRPKEVETPRSLASLAAAVMGPSMSMLDLYEVVNEMLLSIPSDPTTCSKLCPCAVIDGDKHLCTRPRILNRDGRCVEIDEVDEKFGDIPVPEADETRCPTVAIEEASPQGDCKSGTPPLKTGYALFSKDWDNALCYHYHPDYYCDPKEPFKCANGLYSPLKCCKTKCLVKLCEKRRDLYETFGYVNLYRPGRCVLRGLAADVSFNVIKQHSHCRAVCEDTFKV